MTDDTLRAAFEAWHFGGISLSGLREGNGYTDSGVQARWEDWQAARAATLEAAAQACEVPVCCEDKGPDGVCCQQLRHQTADECAARIRALGAK